MNNEKGGAEGRLRGWLRASGRCERAHRWGWILAGGGALSGAAWLMSGVTGSPVLEPVALVAGGAAIASAHLARRRAEARWLPLGTADATLGEAILIRDSGVDLDEETGFEASYMSELGLTDLDSMGESEADGFCDAYMAWQRAEAVRDRAAWPLEGAGFALAGAALRLAGRAGVAGPLAGPAAAALTAAAVAALVGAAALALREYRSRAAVDSLLSRKRASASLRALGVEDPDEGALGRVRPTGARGYALIVLVSCAAACALLLAFRALTLGWFGGHPELAAAGEAYRGLVDRTVPVLAGVIAATGAVASLALLLVGRGPRGGSDGRSERPCR